MNTNNPWWQAVSYSLAKFANSAVATTEYQVFLIEKNDLLKTLADKEELATKILQDTEYLMQNIKISLAEFLGNFWSEDCCFRFSDGLFLKYEGANGLLAHLPLLLNLSKEFNRIYP